MDAAYGEKVIIPGVTHVVNTVTGHSGRVHKFLPKFGVQVWNLKDFNRENWYWHIVNLRTPRSIKRYPRPLRFPRETPSAICHCPSGKEEVKGETVRCLKCGKPIGTESFPKRLRRAEVKYRKQYAIRLAKANSRSEVQKGIRRPKNRKAPRQAVYSLNEGKNNRSRVRPIHGGRVAKIKTKPQRASVPKRRKISRSKKVPTVRKGRKAA